MSLRRILSLLLLCIELPLSALIYIFKIRFLKITALGRVGHLAAEPETFIKLGILGLRPRYYGVLICPKGVAANECLLDYWSRFLYIVRAPLLEKISSRLFRFSYLQYDISRYWVAINKTAPFIEVERYWGDLPPILKLSDAHRVEGRKWLKSLGVPEDAPFICFHCREEGYSPSDDSIQAYRNSSVINYMAAINELTSRGYWCIRMGDPNMRPLSPMGKVIDYAHLLSRSDKFDLFLCASCTFFLGSSSGLLLMAKVFGRPCANANQVPASTVLAFGKNDVATPKLLWSKVEGRYLTFQEIFKSEIANFRFTDLYQKHNIYAVENTSEDVLELALEMLDRVEGLCDYSKEDESLQLRFKALMREGHYSFRGCSRVGRHFLRKYEYLIGDKSKV